MNMFILYKKPLKYKVICEKCKERGWVDENCYKCGGHGIRNRTNYIWDYKPIEIERIDRESFSGDLRYWEDNDNFYLESNRLIQPSERDAKRECERRNERDNGEEFCKKFIKNNLK